MPGCNCSVFGARLDVNKLLAVWSHSRPGRGDRAISHPIGLVIC